MFTNEVKVIIESEWLINMSVEGFFLHDGCGQFYQCVEVLPCSALTFASVLTFRSMTLVPALAFPLDVLCTVNQVNIFLSQASFVYSAHHSNKNKLIGIKVIAYYCDK